ncbi:ABC transporter substrate-binding protein [Variovorax ginsengisoli]|uniref:Multiple sugar transport system substrate-binding protein n=1 Tax=Variovorax ginsengisoli TaxID=363844 RepID=A0ABT9S4X9_9BURK|nr:ABC transporter substrate-binding protein [Variovorax ginsengisoli]MDP9899285.1 multiple sugar transport system substrate-binding protein [Variovorax ginsengisoli]
MKNPTQRLTRLAAAACLCLGFAAHAQNIDWKHFDGESINVLLNNHPWSNAIRDMAPEFTAKTGIKLRVELLNEDPQRARLGTLLQAKSPDIDVFNSLQIREGAVYAKAGWYADLMPLLGNKTLTALDFNYEDFGEGLRKATTFNGKVVALPINVEGPLFYTRSDIFARCKVEVPAYLEDIPAAAAKLKACDPAQGVWDARGVRNAIPYSMASFVFNSGGDFKSADKKQPGLCQPKTIAGMAMYADLLKNYGPVGAINHSFPQVVELLGQGKIAMTHESSNEFSNIMKYPGRDNDIQVRVLPKGRESGISKPVAFGFGLSISAYSKKKDAAWYFLQWATSAEVESKLVSKGVAPPRASVFDGPAMRTWASEKPVRQQWVDALREISRTGTGDYASPTDRVPETREIIGRAVQEMVLGEKSPKDAACAADADLAKLQ